MLLNQWFAWWEEIPTIESGERLSAYTTSLLADSGWKMDERENILASWRELANGKTSRPALPADQESEPTADETEQFYNHVKNVHFWLTKNFKGIDGSG